MYIRRLLYEKLSRSVIGGRVLLLLGPRQVGKSSLVQEFLKNNPSEKILSFNGDDLFDRDLLSNKSKKFLGDLVSETSLLFIDEAHKIENINLTLKILVDNYPQLKIIASGSASFDLMSKVYESLAGRSLALYLYPITQLELSTNKTIKESLEELPSRLIYGSYPKVITLKSQQEQEEYLRDFVKAFLYKDIFEYEGIKNSIKINRLLQLIALQIGKDVSLSELGTQLSLDKETVARYLDLLEKTFVLIERSAYSTGNQRKEISKSKRYYFYDNGIRNIIINNLNPLQIRSGSEIGQLWENYIISERLKFISYNTDITKPNSYFWRNYQQSEIDLIEQYGDQLNAFEIKWNGKESLDAPFEWQRACQKAKKNSNYLVINQKNYLEFIGAKK